MTLHLLSFVSEDKKKIVIQIFSFTASLVIHSQIYCNQRPQWHSPPLLSSASRSFTVHNLFPSSFSSARRQVCVCHRARHPPPLPSIIHDFVSSHSLGVCQGVFSAGFFHSVFPSLPWSSSRSSFLVLPHPCSPRCHFLVARLNLHYSAAYIQFPAGLSLNFMSRVSSLFSFM